MKTRKVVLTHSPQNKDTEPFIQHSHSRKHQKHTISLQERHQKYIETLSIWDRILTRSEDFFKRNNIASSLVSVVIIGIVFIIVFLCVIAFLSNYREKTSSHLILRSSKSKMASTSGIKSTNTILKKIRVLLISDIHFPKGHENLKKVAKYISSSKIKIDHLWAPGDFLNIKDEDNDDEKKLEQAENDLIKYLNDIKKIHPKPIIIPGNHDPKTLFSTDNDKYFKFGECVNIHNKLYKVEGENNLFMAGFGGSVPAFCDSKLFWTGYPYQNEDEFGKEYNAFIDGIINDKDDLIKTNKSIILFTHNGPSMSSTTMDWRQNDQTKIIKTGSESVMKSLLNEKLRDKLICSIHGHTHLGVGQANIGNIKVINPGSLKGSGDNHNFALLDLIQFKDLTWKIDNVQFKNVAHIQLS